MNFYVQNEGINSDKKSKVNFFRSGDQSALVEVKGTTEMVLEHTTIDNRLPYNNPISRASLRVGIWIENAQMEADIVDEINSNIDETIFKARWQLSGAGTFLTQWEGYVIRDLCEREVGEFPYRFTLVARDLTQLRGYYETDRINRKTIIEVFGELLGSIGVGVGIKTITGYTNSTGLEFPLSDYLRQIRINTSQLNEGGRESKEPVLKQKALDTLLKNNNLILFQSENYWWLVNMSGLQYGSDVATYNYDGTLVSEQQEDVSDIIALLRGSTVSNVPIPKEVSVRYYHYSRLNTLSVVNNFVVSTNPHQRSFTSYFQSDGTQRVKVSFSVSALIPSDIEDPLVSCGVAIRVGNDWYGRVGTSTWSQSFNTFRVDMQNEGIPATNNEDSYLGTFSITTANTPNPLTGPDEIEVRFFGATYIHDSAPEGGTKAGSTVFHSVEVEILNELEYQEDYADYVKEIQGNVSFIYPRVPVIYGDLIGSSSKGGLLNFQSQFLSQGWTIRGEGGTPSGFIWLLINDIVGFYGQPKSVVSFTHNDIVKIGKTFTFGGTDMLVVSSRIDLFNNRSAVVAIDIGRIVVDGEGEIDRGNVPIPIANQMGAINAVDSNGSVKDGKIDKSEVLSVDAGSQSSLYFEITGETTAISLKLGQANTLTISGFKAVQSGSQSFERQVSEGQEIILYVEDPDEGAKFVQFSTQATANIENVVSQSGNAFVARANNASFGFKRIKRNGSYVWLNTFKAVFEDQQEEPPVVVVESPYAIPQSGSYINPQEVQLFTNTSSAIIKYGTSADNITTVYTGAISVQNDITLYARAELGDDVSSVSEFNYQILGATVNPVSFDPSGTEFDGSIDVSLSCTTDGALIYYTLNGSDPNSGSTQYTSPINISITTTLKAIAVLTVDTVEYTSEIRSQEYTLVVQPDPVVSKPLFSPEEGEYNQSIQVEIYSEDAEANIHYTLDGSEPTTADPEYALPISIGEGTTVVKAITTKAGHQNNSNEATYFIYNDGGSNDNPPTAQIVKQSRDFVESISTEITMGGNVQATSQIFYTVDGSDPDQNANLYTGELTFTETTVLRAAARLNPSATEFGSIDEAIYTKVAAKEYKEGWNLVSHPYRNSLKERELKRIFNNKLVQNTVFCYDGSYVEVKENIFDSKPQRMARGGEGFWLNLSESVTVDWEAEISAGRKYNQLANPLMYEGTGQNGTVYSPTNKPKTWEVESTDSFGVFYYDRVDQSKKVSYKNNSTGFEIVRIYIDDPDAIVSYGQQDWNISMDLKGDTSIDETRVGFVVSDMITGNQLSDQYEIVSLPQTEYQTVTKTITIVPNMAYIRPYIELRHTFSAPTSLVIINIKTPSVYADLEIETNEFEVPVYGGSVGGDWRFVGSLGVNSAVRDENDQEDLLFTGTTFAFDGSYIDVGTNELERGLGYWQKFKQSATSYKIVRADSV